LDVLGAATTDAELMELRNHPDPDVRWLATIKLAGPAPRSAEHNGLFKPLLFDEDIITEVTTDPVSCQKLTLVELWVSARSRGDVSFQELVPDLSKLLADEDPWVRQVAASILGHCGSPAAAAMPALRRRFEEESSDLEVRWRAALAMEKIEPGSMVAEIKEAIQDADVLPYVLRAMKDYAETGPAGTQFMEDLLDVLCRIETGEISSALPKSDLDDCVVSIENMLSQYGHHEPRLVELYRSYFGRGADESISWVIEKATE